MKSKIDATEPKELNIESSTVHKEEQKMDTDYKLNENAKSEQARTTDDDKGSNVFSVFYGFLFPKIAPIRWTTFLWLSILIAIP